MTLPSNDRAAAEALFALGFRMTAFDTLRSLDPPMHASANVEVLRVGPDGLDDVMVLQDALHAHLSAGPIFLPLQPRDHRARREAWLREESNAMWVAFSGGSPIAGIGFEPSSGMVLPTAADGQIAITFGSTLPASRRSGVATAVFARGLEWARAEGYRSVSVDFESANLAGSSRSSASPTRTSAGARPGPRS